ncbi:MAG TPA: hypothetical protein VGS97_23210 [Actinocrinis sp.]|uniref:hypothetical protein n=1 Tax=Actinocrinis sp. TaxID=1920516 RepID=UPI002DDD7FDD|nr:hypothetical protein [Actinocrinis sp.]HEV2347030.1 hypothetical protein [Actinocrinis sp.]
MKSPRRTCVFDYGSMSASHSSWGALADRTALLGRDPGWSGRLGRVVHWWERASAEQIAQRTHRVSRRLLRAQAAGPEVFRQVFAEVSSEDGMLVYLLGSWANLVAGHAGRTGAQVVDARVAGRPGWARYLSDLIDAGADGPRLKSAVEAVLLHIPADEDILALTAALAAEVIEVYTACGGPQRLAEVISVVAPQLAEHGISALGAPLGYLLAATALGNGSAAAHLLPRLQARAVPVVVALAQLAARAKGEGRSVVRLDPDGVPAELFDVEQLPLLADAEDAQNDVRLIALYDQGIEAARRGDQAASAAFAARVRSLPGEQAALLTEQAVTSTALFIGQTWSSGSALEP